jgi:hypothetical protein
MKFHAVKFGRCSSCGTARTVPPFVLGGRPVVEVHCACLGSPSEEQRDERLACFDEVVRESAPEFVDAFEGKDVADLATLIMRATRDFSAAVLGGDPELVGEALVKLAAMARVAACVAVETAPLFDEEDPNE